jgi:hypothetical protein
LKACGCISRKAFSELFDPEPSLRLFEDWGGIFDWWNEGRNSCYDQRLLFFRIFHTLPLPNILSCTKLNRFKPKLTAQQFTTHRNFFQAAPFYYKDRKWLR